MKRGLALFALFILPVLYASAQSPKPSATPPEQEPIVKISTSLIQIDVTVTDKSGKPIADLRPEEIEIYENGKKQTITNFSFISSGIAVAEKTGDPSRRSEKVPVPRPAPAPPQSGAIRRTIAVVVDDLSMSWESIGYARRALKKLVDEQMQDGDLVAILRTGASIGSLQRFTTDKRILLAAIEKIKYNPMGTGGVAATNELTPTGTETLDLVDSGLPGGEADREAFLAAAETRRTGMLASGTLGSLEYVVAGMADIPGRKSLLLFSDGFDLFERDKNDMRQSGLAIQYARRLIEQANRAGVVFYPIDPRGLQVSSLQAIDNTRRMTAKSMMTAVETRRQRLWDSQSGINFLAKETGGIAFFNDNDPSGGVERALEDQSYYLVAYVPDEESFDKAASKFNKFDVKVLRKGATVRFRSGFFGVTDAKKIAAAAPDKSANAVVQLKTALLSPFEVGGVALRLNSLFGSGGVNDLYVRSLLHIDANDLKFKDEKNGQKTCSFEVLATSFGPDGQLADQIGKTYTVTVPPDVYTRVLADGIVYHFKFPAKKAGSYQYRVAIRDAVGGNIGAAGQFVEVPDLSGGRLTLSSIVVEDMSIDDFDRALKAGSEVKTDPMRDTSLRRIQVGRVYRYSLEIYNAGLDAAKKPDLETRIRVFREGKLILDGPPKRLDATHQADLAHPRFLGGLAIGAEMEPGDYVLQIIVSDNSRKGKRDITSQFVQFEVVP